MGESVYFAVLLKINLNLTNRRRIIPVADITICMIAIEFFNYVCNNCSTSRRPCKTDTRSWRFIFESSIDLTVTEQTGSIIPVLFSIIQ